MGVVCNGEAITGIEAVAGLLMFPLVFIFSFITVMLFSDDTEFRVTPARVLLCGIFWAAGVLFPPLLGPVAITTLFYAGTTTLGRRKTWPTIKRIKKFTNRNKMAISFFVAAAIVVGALIRAQGGAVGTLALIVALVVGGGIYFHSHDINIKETTDEPTNAED